MTADFQKLAKFSCGSDAAKAIVDKHIRATHTKIVQLNKYRKKKGLQEKQVRPLVITTRILPCRLHLQGLLQQLPLLVVLHRQLQWAVVDHLLPWAVVVVVHHLLPWLVLLMVQRLLPWVVLNHLLLWVMLGHV